MRLLGVFICKKEFGLCFHRTGKKSTDCSEGGIHLVSSYVDHQPVFW